MSTIMSGIIGERRKVTRTGQDTYQVCVPKPWIRLHQKTLKEHNREVWVVFSKNAIVILPPDAPPETLGKAREFLEGLNNDRSSRGAPKDT